MEAWSIFYIESCRRELLENSYELRDSDYKLTSNSYELRAYIMMNYDFTWCNYWRGKLKLIS